MLVARNLICVSSLFQSLHFLLFCHQFAAFPCFPAFSNVFESQNYFHLQFLQLRPLLAQILFCNMLDGGCFGGCVTQHRITKKTNNANKYLKSTFKILLPIQFLFSLFSPELALFHTSMLGCRIPEG